MECYTKKIQGREIYTQLLVKNIYEYFEFKELDSNSREKAIENVRNAKYEGDYGGSEIEYVIVDNDELFEPPHKEMTDLFGENYYQSNGNNFMIANTRKNIYFKGKQESGSYIHCSKAIYITNDRLFLRWLGIPSKFHRYSYYTFSDLMSWNTSIEFEIDDLTGLVDSYGEDSEKKLENYFKYAEQKFSEHMDYVLDKITKDIDYQFEKEEIINTIEYNNIKFKGDGSIFEE